MVLNAGCAKLIGMESGAAASQPKAGTRHQFQHAHKALDAFDVTDYPVHFRKSCPVMKMPAIEVPDFRI